ncbi:hypothetical protein BC826DRAFT_402737 [Russula brevipes]|nr:hypothetical protein BC826DRAFT_402737 [Russula brevipes]
MLPNRSVVCQSQRRRRLGPSGRSAEDLMQARKRAKGKCVPVLPDVASACLDSSDPTIFGLLLSDSPRAERRGRDRQETLWLPLHVSRCPGSSLEYTPEASGSIARPTSSHCRMNDSRVCNEAIPRMNFCVIIEPEVRCRPGRKHRIATLISIN